MLLSSESILASSPQDLRTDFKLILTPAQARQQGLSSLREAVRRDGGVPLPSTLNEYVKDRAAAILLGKALFWDMQVGSDGIQACASCHFHAGTDNRITNAVNPDEQYFDVRTDDVIGYSEAPFNPDSTFEVRQPNETLRRTDFPFIRSIQQLVRTAEGEIRPFPGNTNDVVGSMGIFFSFFGGVQAGSPVDLGSTLSDPVFNVGGTTVRAVEHRNTPSIINAVFNFTNFWDGRADPHFNGRTSFGVQDPAATIFVNDPLSGVSTGRISIDNASLASQAVAPPVNPIEQGFGDFSQGNGRRFREIGLKLLRRSPLTGAAAVPLALQIVHPQDSVLGGLSNAPQRGLATTYETLIKQAFVDKYWNSPTPLRLASIPAAQDFTQMEANFSLFFGLAIQLYESTLVSSRTPFDQWMENGRLGRDFGVTELAGLNLFVNQGRCIQCHSGPELTKASVRSAANGTQAIRAMAMAEGVALYDNGFFNLSVTPITDDLGRGDISPVGPPLSFTRQALFDRLGIQPSSTPIIGNDHIPARDQDLRRAVCVDSNANGVCEPTEALNAQFQRAAVDGAFKVPGLRNAELTGPYFHNGGMATLRQVVQFYNRGGNFCDFNSRDLDANIRPLGLNRLQEEQLVAFLMSLTDERVKYQQAPFDHPQLRIPNDGLDTVGTRLIAAVGAQGSREALQPFLELNPQDAIFTPRGLCFKGSR